MDILFPYEVNRIGKYRNWKFNQISLNKINIQVAKYLSETTSKVETVTNLKRRLSQGRNCLLCHHFIEFYYIILRKHLLCVQVSPNFIPSLTFFFNNLSNAKVKHYTVSNKKMNKKSNSIKLLCPRKLEKTNSRFHYKTVFKEIW